ncbi:MAG: type IV secretory system conjugative DNA transfer family protein [Clostridia bacterium]|nr:type IV secretory system conjugative DNA transfer family protein [Clostridia bacterium]
MDWKKISFRALISLVLAMLVSVVGVFLAYGTLAPLPFLIMTLILTIVISLIQTAFWGIGKTKGELYSVLGTAFTGFLISCVFGIVVYSIIYSRFRFRDMDWVRIFKSFPINYKYWLAVLIIWVGFFVLYYGFINREQLPNFFRKGIRGKGKLGQIEANLENSRWMTETERDKIFSSCKYSELNSRKKDGIPIRATLDGKDMNITFNSPCHSLIIGSTGSGKTTTFVNPMIQILAASSAGSSMLITDPKGELFSLHSKFLASRGYDVKVLDLRDAYHSYRWNPLEPLWDTYREYAEAENEIYKRNDDPAASGLKMVGKAEDFGEYWYEFKGRAIPNIGKLQAEVKIYKAQKYDEMYEDMSDLVSVLVPVANQNDPMWEKGARSITMAVLLAMLEDSDNPELGMTKEKFNLFNMSKILQNSEGEYKELRRFFAGRDKLSKATALSKQVMDAAEKTRSSYMSVLLEKLSLFNDTGICGLTATSDFNTADLALKPTAIFVKIPDEKDTRHGLASIFMTNVYKSLIKISTQYEDLSLPRNVYYILDEFGNMPKIEKFDKMITVGRSRKIWFNMIVQSYVQLNNVYGDTVADIVKGNCGIKMFIGSNDMGTCKEFSELCGNITVVTQGSSSSGKDNTNYSQNIQTRPLIYPSELQKLNNKTSTGNSIIVTFGNYPLKTKFTPSYKAPMYEMGMMDTAELDGRYFDERAVFYDIAERNAKIVGG